MFIPIMYAGMYLWAFWDPYGNLDKLPVAVVNDDAGASLDGNHLKLGEDLVSNLKKNKNFAFDFVEKKKAYKELNNQKYYLVIEIPNDFSENATTLLNAKPKKLELIYTTNEGLNFISSQIGGTAVEKIKTAVAEQITKTYAETMFDKISGLTDGVVEASDGSIQLSKGAIDVNNGSKDLHEGLATLAEKSIEFNQGVKDVSSGSEKLVSGTNDLKNGLTEADNSLPQLIAGTEKANSSVEQLKRDLPAGIAAEMDKQVTGSIGGLDAGINQFESQLSAQLSSQIADQTIADQTAKMQELANVLIENGVSADLVNGIMAKQQENAPSKEQIQQQIASELSPNLNAGFSQFKAGMNQQLSVASTGLEEKIKNQTDPYFDQLIGGIGKINDGQKTLQSGIHALYVGSAQLNDGTNNLSAGVEQLSNGSEMIKTGAGQLANGSEKLQDGTTKLSDGAKELADKLFDGAKEASTVHGDEKTYNMIASPVKLEKENINHVPNYGTGLAPYFISLGLFVGALLLTIVFPVRDTAVVPTSGFNWFISKFSIMAGVGVFQALIADIILLVGVGLDVQSIPRFVLFSIITSLTYISLIQLLVSAFADVGRFIAIIILILQLTTSAGTFPLELIPDFLQNIHAFLPMTYAVQGFKSVISSGDYSYMWHNLLFLVSFLLVCAAGTITYFTMRQRHLYKHQHTVIE